MWQIKASGAADGDDGRGGLGGPETGLVWARAAGRVPRRARLRHRAARKSAREVVVDQAQPQTGRSRRGPGRRPKEAVPAPETRIALSHPDKLLWPDAGLTKRGLLAYYQSVWPLMRPHVVDRPLSLLRAPGGVGKPTFFQKHASAGMDRAIATLRDPKDGEELLSIADFDGLAALVQLGVVEIHVWGSTIAKLEKPDQVIFDLDPDPGVPLDRVRAAAVALRDRLADLGLASFAKTSGGKGFHVVVPLEPQAEWSVIKTFAHDFARGLELAEPKAYTAAAAKSVRKGKIFIDYLRNGRGATAIAPYSTRARPGAPIAMPVSWQAVEEGIGPADCRVGSPTLRAILKTDPWRDFRAEARTLQPGGTG